MLFEGDERQLARASSNEATTAHQKLHPSGGSRMYFSQAMPFEILSCFTLPLGSFIVKISSHWTASAGTLCAGERESALYIRYGSHDDNAACCLLLHHILCFCSNRTLREKDDDIRAVVPVLGAAGKSKYC